MTPTPAPWLESEGHGPVSDWTTRDKRPGELVLSEDGRARRFYDFSAACKLARADGWDAAPCNTGQESKRQQAQKAALSDFGYLRRWCAGQSDYGGTDVTYRFRRLDDDGRRIEYANGGFMLDSINGPKARWAKVRRIGAMTPGGQFTA